MQCIRLPPLSLWGSSQLPVVTKQKEYPLSFSALEPESQSLKPFRAG